MSHVENPSMFMPIAKYRIQFVIVMAYLDFLILVLALIYTNGREQHWKGIGAQGCR